MSSKKPGKKNKAKLEKAAAEKAAADRKKAKKGATGEQRAKIKAQERAAVEKEKVKKQKAKAREKEQKAADREKNKQLRQAQDEELARMRERLTSLADDDDEDEAVNDVDDDDVDDKIAEEKKTFDAEDEPESDDDSEEDEDDDNTASIYRVCRCCGERNAQHGKEYCKECEKLLLRTHLPVRGFVVTFVSIVVSFFVLIVMGLLSSASLQIAKGDFYMQQKNYNTAFTIYDDVASIISEINENFGDDSIFTKIVSTGSNFDYRAMECAVKMYGPISAISSFDSNIFVSTGAAEFKEHSLRYKNLSKPYDEFESTITALDPILSEISEDEDMDLEGYNKKIPEIEAYAEKDGVNKVDLEYIIAMFADQLFTVDDAQLIKYMEKVDKAAKESGEDYSWLYYQDYTTMLVAEGDYEKATPYLIEMMENDLSNYYSRIQMCRILVSRGKSDEAAAIAEEYSNNNYIDDDYTENAYALLIYMSRALGNYETALHLASSSLNTYTYVPEIRRQQAMAYMSMGYYQEAFDAAYQASYDASYISSYYAISDFDGTLLDETLYVATYLVADVIDEDDEDEVSKYDEVVSMYTSGDYIPQFSQKIVDGDVDIQKALTEGTCDFI